MNKQRKQLIFYVVGIISLGFIVLSTLVYIFPNLFIDREFSMEVQEHQNPTLDLVMKRISWAGHIPNSLIIVVVASVLFYLFRFRKETLYVLLTLLSGPISTLMKIVVNRPRPTEPIVRIIETAKSQSFPSGHVLFYVVFFGFLTVLMFHLKSIPKKIRFFIATISLLLIFSIPFSRLYLGAHWFTDVLGGFLLGIICLSILSFQYFRNSD